MLPFRLLHEHVTDGSATHCPTTCPHRTSRARTALASISRVSGSTSCRRGKLRLLTSATSTRRAHLAKVVLEHKCSGSDAGHSPCGIGIGRVRGAGRQVTQLPCVAVSGAHHTSCEETHIKRGRRQRDIFGVHNRLVVDECCEVELKTFVASTRHLRALCNGGRRRDSTKLGPCRSYVASRDCIAAVLLRWRMRAVSQQRTRAQTAHLVHSDGVLRVALLGRRVKGKLALGRLGCGT